MANQLGTQYNPQAIEGRLYEKWMAKKYFAAKIDRSKKPFTIVMPPPNITGQLHMGHALDNTLQDAIIRYKRMSGFAALWLPGTDHASIATEAKIVEAMRKEGITKEEIGREEFLRRAWAWKEQYGNRIVSQLKKMGSSCDWDRERFTMDEGCSRAVKEVFVRLYDQGLIYRGNRIINWCPKCLTSISDAEVEYEDKPGHFWHIRYPFKDGSGYLEVATTRPETLLGDTAVAVNPTDERYAGMVGKTLILPLVGREIPVIADDYVEKDFGTGCVKITPAHDPNDFEVGLRHNLPVLNMMTPDAHVTEDYLAYAGMDRDAARKAIVRDLKEGGFLLRTEEYTHNVGTCYRCHTVIEPRVSLQWFVRMKPLAEPAIAAVRSGETRFLPDRFSKNYFHWMENIRDWCISRQLWWGHRIPAFYCDDCDKTVVTKADSAVCPDCGKAMRQDPDTLDTWFSSALWPFSTLGWPDQTEDLDYFYPTNTLVTGYDIITFWVSRMIFSGIAYTGKTPFDTVLIHGLVRDAQGRKMSKSLGNGIDPLEIIEQYGADALRMTLLMGVSPGNDMNFSDDKVTASRNFCNKIWNASRFILMNLEKAPDAPYDPAELKIEDKWILSRVNGLCRTVTDFMDRYELGLALQNITDFFWDEFCDWYIEMVKQRLWNGTDGTKGAALHTLRTVLLTALKLLHPFMPFITEELYCSLQDEEETIMLSDWPVYRADWVYTEDEAAVEIIKQAVKAIRQVRLSMNVPPSKKIDMFVVSADAGVRSYFESSCEFFAMLGNAAHVTVQADKTGIDDDAVPAVADRVTIFMPVDEMVDIAKEIARLEGEQERIRNEIARSDKMLENPGFVAKAPAQKVEQEREKRQKNVLLLAGVGEQLERMRKRFR